MRKKILTGILILSGLVAISQTPETFSISLEPITVADAPGIHSYAWAKDSQGRWLIVGGRVDGLHERQPFAAFLEQSNNKNVFVIDPATNQSWNTSLSGLSTDMYDQLQSTNQEFYQVGNSLYVIGGYGYSTTATDHITFPHLTVIDVDAVTNAVVNGSSVNSFFRQIVDSNLAVTGGQIGYLDSTFYLAGGQLFEGRYNPMGPNHGPGFIQQYSDEIRKFKISDDGTNISITNYSATNDVTNLHRRDYNMAAQIFPNGDEGFTMFSGVFQVTADLPYLNSVDITPTGHTVNNTFNQYLSQYHSAKIPVFDSLSNTMSTLFFGGMSQYTLDASGNLIEDQDVPFVKTISKVSRFTDGTMEEVKFSTEMPTLLGAGAEFIPLGSAPYHNNEILKLNDLPNSKYLIGYIYGGIESTQENIFFVNDGSQSSASKVIFEVYIDKSVNGINDKTITPENIFALKVYPNPAKRKINVDFYNPNPKEILINIMDANGKNVKTIDNGIKTSGHFTEKINISELDSGMYILDISNGIYKTSKSFIVK